MCVSDSSNAGCVTLMILKLKEGNFDESFRPILLVAVARRRAVTAAKKQKLEENNSSKIRRRT